MAKKVAKAAKGSNKSVSRGANISALVIRKSTKHIALSKGVSRMIVAPVASSIVEDHLAIVQLLHKYCHVVDRGSAEDIAALFHENAVLLPRSESDERYEGRNAVRGWYQHYMKNFRSKVRYLRHKIESPVIEIIGTEATSVCYLDADSITVSSNVANVACGRYEDKFIKDGGRWWFKERAIIVYYSYPVMRHCEGRGA
jgi:hypothetical protein